MDISTGVLALLATVLALVNLYQFLVMRSALRIAEILYVMSRNVREKAAEVRRTNKDVEIIEAHLFDIATSARSLLRSLGRGEKHIDPDPALSLSSNGHPMSSDSLIRLADNVFYAVREEHPEYDWNAAMEAALERFQRKVPTVDRSAARKILTVVASEHRTRALRDRVQAGDGEETRAGATGRRRESV